MGQRHQIFVKIANPAKHLYAKPAEKRELEKEFGTGEFAILVWHHGWLFGRNALQTALRLLVFASQFTREQKSDPKAWGGYRCPFGINGMKQRFNRDQIINSLEFIINYQQKSNNSTDAGIDEAWYISKREPEFRYDFTCGDNNDGITILDLVDNKYCFMNINNTDRKAYRANRLLRLKPSTAREYVACYYGETIASTNPYKFGDHDRRKVTMSKEDQQKMVNEFIKGNEEASAPFAEFGLLTKDEIKVMFAQPKPSPEPKPKVKREKITLLVPNKR